jgi:hypothetical protein
VLFAVLLVAVLIGIVLLFCLTPATADTIHQDPDGSVCWSAITDTVWHMEDGHPIIDSQRVVGSGRIILPPGASEETKARHVHHMQSLAFNGALAGGPVSQSVLTDGLRYCWGCGGTGYIEYPGLWDLGLWQCLPCLGRTCRTACRPSPGTTCPPAC